MATQDTEGTDAVSGDVWLLGAGCALCAVGIATGTLSLTYRLVVFVVDLGLVRTSSDGQLRAEVLALHRQFRLVERKRGKPTWQPAPEIRLTVAAIRGVVMVGDRGMLTSARIEVLREVGGVGWISALRSTQIEALVNSGDLQLEPVRPAQSGRDVLPQVSW